MRPTDTVTSVGKVPKPYDLLWPVGKRNMSMETAPKVVDGSPTGTTNAPTQCVCELPACNEILKLCSACNGSRSLDDLRDYGQRLLATFPDPDATDVRIKVPLVSPVHTEFEREREGDGGVLTGCREAVEILTRNPKKGK